MTIKSDNPSREELLNELVSIRDSLLPESDRPHSSTGGSSSALNKTNEPLHSPSKPKQTETTHDKDDIMDPLPGQQSLFDENAKKNTNAAEKQSATDPKKAQKAPNPINEANIQERENPFLPHHMKQKLEKEKLLYQQQINSQNNLQSPSALAPTSTPVLPARPLSSSITKNAMELMEVDEALIDELVEIYLPKIEQDLRQRIRKRLKHTK